MSTKEGHSRANLQVSPNTSLAQRATLLIFRAAMFRDLIFHFGELCRILATFFSTLAIYNRIVPDSDCKVRTKVNSKQENHPPKLHFRKIYRYILWKNTIFAQEL